MQKKIPPSLNTFGLHEVEEPQTFFDLVCGMELTPNTIQHSVTYADGTTYHFCSMSCKDHFINDPQTYIG